MLRFQQGFTLTETLIATALLAVGADAVVGALSEHFERARIEQTRHEITQLREAIETYRSHHHELPASLTELGSSTPLDPWGHSYEYVNFDTSGTVGQRAYDGLPINSEYDLYSRGPDGHTDANLETESARDDIVTARDGGFVGSAADF